jgi:hypothetical protein
MQLSDKILQQEETNCMVTRIEFPLAAEFDSLTVCDKDWKRSYAFILSSISECEGQSFI